MAKKKTKDVWVNVCGRFGLYYFISRCKPTWRRADGSADGGFWEAQGEWQYERYLMVNILRLCGLKRDHAYRVDLIKALQGKPFILETLAPPKEKQ